MEKIPTEQLPTPDTPLIEPYPLDTVTGATEKSFFLPPTTEAHESSTQDKQPPQAQEPTTSVRPLTHQAERAKEYLQKFRSRHSRSTKRTR